MIVDHINESNCCSFVSGAFPIFSSKGNHSNSFLKLNAEFLVLGLAPNEGFSSFSLNLFLPLVSLASGSISVALLKISSLRSLGGTCCNLISYVSASLLFVLMGSVPFLEFNVPNSGCIKRFSDPNII